jgi:hypothetical protein
MGRIITLSMAVLTTIGGTGVVLGQPLAPEQDQPRRERALQDFYRAHGGDGEPTGRAKAYSGNYGVNRDAIDWRTGAEFGYENATEINKLLPGTYTRDGTCIPEELRWPQTPGSHNKGPGC